MKWKYYIPHTWRTLEDRTVWEDVYLMPDIEFPEGQEKASVWLTVDGLGNTPWEEDEEGWRKYWAAVELLKTREYIIDKEDADMFVRAEDFNFKELLEYAKIFVKEVFGDQDVILVGSGYEDFLGTNKHIAFLEELADKVIASEGKKGEGQEED